MTKLILLFLLLCNSISVISQEKVNSDKLGFSLPLIWNNSSGVYYSLGNRREPVGNAISYGANINYSHFILKNLFIVGGVGYWNQTFNIQRPFQYRTPDGSEPLVNTNNYSYQNIQLLIGAGYQKMISDRWSLAGQLTYNIYNSYRQKYTQEYSPGKNEIFKTRFIIGSIINLDLRCERYISNRVSIGTTIFFPIYTHWNDDKMFNKYDYSDDSQIIAYQKSSFGASLSIYYQLKNKKP